MGTRLWLSGRGCNPFEVKIRAVAQSSKTCRHACTEVVTQYIVVTISVLVSSHFPGFCFSYNSLLISNACLFVE